MSVLLTSKCMLGNNATLNGRVLPALHLFAESFVAATAALPITTTYNVTPNAGVAYGSALPVPPHIGPGLGHRTFGRSDYREAAGRTSGNHKSLEAERRQPVTGHIWACFSLPHRTKYVAFAMRCGLRP